MAPEQLGGKVTRATDVFAASVVMWEMLTGKGLFQGEDEGAILSKVLSAPIMAPAALRPDLPAEVNAIVMRGLDRDPGKRFATAREMALALERAGPIAHPSDGRAPGWSPSRATIWPNALHLSAMSSAHARARAKAWASWTWPGSLTA